MKIPFTKMHGLGNNYIYIDLFSYELDETILPELAKAVSNVYTGIGSDGLILIHPSKKADVGMRIFNKDGSEGQSCGNGLRCTAKYAYESGIIDKRKFTMETKANIVEAEVMIKDQVVKEITINMGDPELQRASIPMLGKAADQVVAEPFLISEEELKLTALSMGNPHAVFFVGNIEHAPLYDLGPLIEKDSRFPNGVNVEFVEIISENEVNFRVWERGSGVTQACGTGACAAVVAGVLNHHLRKDEPVIVHLQGGDLKIRWDHHGKVWMTGDAEVIASGVYHYRMP
ncbi:diaminopimelate epimerase [Virgibacillus halodenitrificans]|uniref:diaminopimelate epimerase n=1 Tax=Virgibacillus halodenitrificans TaxID=1482 RepID=UPI001EEECED2|nr:diaminopimelate epimerase [Virgibacillus halodenitrificans]MCG1026980.1 diaminopimelate epimerase [Virgibacillus halodenitrificans]